MRLFIGLQVNETVRQALANVTATLAPRVEAKYVPALLYHLTLVYLGERPESALPDLCSLLAETAATGAPFQLAIHGLGFFQNAENAILYADVEPCGELLALDMALRQRLTLAAEGFDPKPLKPHITLARKVRLVDGLPSVTIPDLCFPVEAVTLFHSTRIDGELRYIPIFVSPLSRE